MLRKYFASKSVNNLSPSVFNTWLIFSSDQHSYQTSCSTKRNLIKLFYKTNRYGKYSITIVLLTYTIIKQTTSRIAKPYILKKKVQGTNKVKIEKNKIKNK